MSRAFSGGCLRSERLPVQKRQNNQSQEAKPSDKPERRDHED
jgi:hypothetical protein